MPVLIKKQIIHNSGRFFNPAYIDIPSDLKNIVCITIPMTKVIHKTSTPKSKNFIEFTLSRMEPSAL